MAKRKKKSLANAIPFGVEDWTKKVPSRPVPPAEPEGRAATKPLYVMLTEQQKARYETAAQAAGMTMREYVVNALDAQLAQQTLTITAENIGEARAGFANDLPLVQELALRIGTLERRVEAMHRLLEREHGENYDLRPVLASDVLSKLDNDKG